MKKALATLALGIFLSSAIYCQQYVGLLFSQNISTFRFIDSEANKADLDMAIKYGYGFSYTYQFNDLFFVNGLLSYDNKGAKDVIDQSRIEWSLHYVSSSINGGISLYSGKLSPRIGAGMYFGRLLQAEQFIDAAFYDLKNEEAIKKNDVGINLFAELDYEFSTSGSIFLKLNQSTGIFQLEETVSSDQRLFNRVFSIQTGFLFTIN